MHYIICPKCNGEIEMPPSAIGPDRTELFNIEWCDECSIGFNYDEEDVITDDRPSTPFN